jgi:hypothetical protein
MHYIAPRPTPPPTPLPPQVPLAKLGTLDQQYWSELHAPGEPTPFKVRGASYLTDRRKIDAGDAEFCLAAVDLVITGTALHHVSRFLPSVRRNKAPFSFVLNLIIPGTPMLSLVLVFVNEHHPDILGQVPPDPSSGDHEWQPFDFLLYRWGAGCAGWGVVRMLMMMHSWGLAGSRHWVAEVLSLGCGEGTAHALVLPETACIRRNTICT